MSSLPQVDRARLERFVSRRPNPSRRASLHAADEEAAQSLLDHADELTLRSIEQQSEHARESALARAMEKDRPIVSIGEWVSNPYYTGRIDLWPAVKDAFVEIYEQGPTIVLFRGGAGTAKSFLSALLLLRAAYEIGSIANPHGRLGNFSAIAPLKMALMHQSHDRARVKQLGTLAGMVRTAGWFQEHFAAQRLAYSPGVNVSHLEFGRTLRIDPVKCDPQTIVSDDLVGMHATEMNEYAIVEGSVKNRGGEQTYDVGWRVFRSALERIRSRFSAPYHRAVKFCFDSAERYEGDVTSRIHEALPKLGIPHVVVQRSNWEMRPGRNRGPWFVFAKPVKGKRGEVVSTKERRAQLREEGRQVVRVPRGAEDEILRAAQDNPDEFSVQQGGWPTDAIGRWIDDAAVFDRCDRARALHLLELGIQRDPVEAFPEKWLLGHSAPDWAVACEKGPDGVYRPRVLPQARRIAHFDLASTGKDYVGFAVGALLDVREGRPVVWYDARVRFLKPGPEYDFKVLRAIFREFRQHGFQFHLLTFDSHQSYEFATDMREEMVRVEQASLERTMDGWKSFRPGLTSGQALLPLGEDSVAREELSQLERRIEKGKEVVRHRPGGHDDEIQACAAVYWQIETHVSELRARPAQVSKASPSWELEERIDRALRQLDNRTERPTPGAIDETERKLAKARRKLDREAAQELRAKAGVLRKRGLRF